MINRHESIPNIPIQPKLNDKIWFNFTGGVEDECFIIARFLGFTGLGFIKVRTLNIDANPTFNECWYSIEDIEDFKILEDGHINSIL